MTLFDRRAAEIFKELHFLIIFPQIYYTLLKCMCM